MVYLFFLVMYFFVEKVVHSYFFKKRNIKCPRTLNLLYYSPTPPKKTTLKKPSLIRVKQI